MKATEAAKALDVWVLSFIKQQQSFFSPNQAGRLKPEDKTRTTSHSLDDNQTNK